GLSAEEQEIVPRRKNTKACGCRCASTPGLFRAAHGGEFDLRATAPFGRRNSILALKSGREMGGAFEAGAQRDFVDCGSAVRRVGKSLVRCIKPELAQRRANRLALVLKDAVQAEHRYPHRR